MSPAADRNRVNLAYGVEHLQNAIRYASRGESVFFDEKDPDTYLLVEGELRKAFESLNKLGASFWTVNPNLGRIRIGEVRNLLTHDYAELDRQTIWSIVKREARELLKRLKRARVPKPEG